MLLATFVTHHYVRYQKGDALMDTAFLSDMKDLRPRARRHNGKRVL